MPRDAPVPAPMKILFVASECAPFAKTGGLGEVICALPPALRRRGLDVRIVMPLYAGMPWHEFEPLEGILEVPMWFGRARARVRLARLPRSEVPVYVLEHHGYFDRPHLYGPATGSYPDNLERFAFLSRAALEVTKALGWIPDVIHAHDWQTALAPVYVDTVEWGRPLHGSATVYTIHNMAYQGVFDEGALFVTGLGREHYHARELEHFGTLNLAKAAFFRSTMLSTVSPTYAREIRTGAFGCGLDGVLSERGADLVGILNGIDVDAWNPAADPHLAARFHAGDLTGKAICKGALQQEAGLPIRPDLPVLGLIARLVPQKGIDVLAHALDRVLGWDVQLVVLGSGEPEAERFLAALARERSDRLCAWIPFDDARAHRIQAGADFLLMPSRFEPCGLSQLCAMRYGTLPIVRATGGLADTVVSYDERTGGGTGFVLHDLRPESLADTIGWAVWTWYHRGAHVALMRQRGMTQDLSWARAAGEYERLYHAAYARRRGHPFGDGARPSRGTRGRRKPADAIRAA